MILTRIWAVMLNNRAKRDSEKVLESLEIKAGDIIADIGSGGGYFTVRLAKRTGSGGKVFAVDTNQKLLLYINKMMKKQHIQNIETVLGREDGCSLPTENCDLIFMRNVFHHIADPVSYFTNIKKSLKFGGRIAIIEWSQSTRRSHVSYAGHCTSEKDIQRVMREAGYTHLNSLDFVDGQSLNIFEKK